MKKFICVGAIFLSFVIGVVASAPVLELIAVVENYNLTIEGLQEQFNAPLVSINDKAYASVRELGEKLGYQIEWLDKEKRIEMKKKMNETTPYYEEMNSMKEGVLSNGARYKYIARNEEQLSDIEMNPLYTKVSSNYGEVPTAQMAASIGQIILGYNFDPDISIHVEFDSNSDNWIISGIVNQPTHSGSRVALINRVTGKIEGKYEIR